MKASQPNPPQRPPRIRKTFPTALAPLKSFCSGPGFSINQTEWASCSSVKPKLLVSPVLGTLAQPSETMRANLAAVRWQKPHSPSVINIAGFKMVAQILATYLQRP
jgi:hypothetical protein